MNLLDHLKALAAKATPGPWHRVGTGLPGVMSEQMREGVWRDVCSTLYTARGAGAQEHSESQDEQIANAAYIGACSPEVIAALVEAAEAVEMLGGVYLRGESAGNWAGVLTVAEVRRIADALAKLKTLNDQHGGTTPAKKEA